MRLCILFVTLSSLACGPSSSSGTESTTNDTESAQGSSSGSSTDPTSTSGAIGWMDDHGPCAADSGCPNSGICVQLDGASICGPECYELGPGFARCPASEVQEQTICPWPTKDAPAACLISCTTAADCPAAGMVCVPCPEPFASDCPLGAMFGAGPDMCAWPDP